STKRSSWLTCVTRASRGGLVGELSRPITVVVKLGACDPFQDGEILCPVHSDLSPLFPTLLRSVPEQIARRESREAAWSGFTQFATWSALALRESRELTERRKVYRGDQRIPEFSGGLSKQRSSLFRHSVRSNTAWTDDRSCRVIRSSTED